MMNKIINIIVLVSLIGFISCSDEDFTGHSTLEATNPSITISGETSISVDEESLFTNGTDEVFEYTIELSEPQIVDVAIYITSGEGTAVEGVNYSLSEHRIVIPARRTTGSFTLTVSDADASGNDDMTFSFTVGDHRTANAEITPVTISGTITPYTYPGTLLNEIELVYAWDASDTLTLGSGDITKDTVISRCDIADFDVGLVLDGNQADFPQFLYYGITLGFDGMTSACPEAEHLSVDDGEGDYFIGAGLFAVATAGSPINLPITVTATRYNDLGDAISSVTFTQSTNIITTDDAPVTDFDNFYVDTGAIIGRINITGTTFEIYDDTDTLVGTL